MNLGEGLSGEGHCSLLSVAAKNTMTKSNLGRKGFISSCRLQFNIERSQNRSLEQKPQEES